MDREVNDLKEEVKNAQKKLSVLERDIELMTNNLEIGKERCLQSLNRTNAKVD